MLFRFVEGLEIITVECKHYDELQRIADKIEKIAKIGS